jgi:hypothetical protein
MNRHGRQTRLSEVGAGGQAKIAGARVRVGGEGLAPLVAARYLAGAGVGSVCVRTHELAGAAARVDAAIRVEVDPSLLAAAPDEAFDLVDPAARAVASGALTALGALREVLGVAGGRS